MKTHWPRSTPAPPGRRPPVPVRRVGPAVSGLTGIVTPMLLLREGLVGLATQAWNRQAPSRSSGKAWHVYPCGFDVIQSRDRCRFSRGSGCIGCPDRFGMNRHRCRLVYLV